MSWTQLASHGATFFCQISPSSIWRSRSRRSQCDYSVSSVSACLMPSSPPVPWPIESPLYFSLSNFGWPEKAKRTAWEKPWIGDKPCWCWAMLLASYPSESATLNLVIDKSNLICMLQRPSLDNANRKLCNSRPAWQLKIARCVK